MGVAVTVMVLTVMVIIMIYRKALIIMKHT